MRLSRSCQSVVFFKVFLAFSDFKCSFNQSYVSMSSSTFFVMVLDISVFSIFCVFVPVLLIFLIGFNSDLFSSEGCFFYCCLLLLNEVLLIKPYPFNHVVFHLRFLSIALIFFWCLCQREFVSGLVLISLVLRGVQFSQRTLLWSPLCIFNCNICLWVREVYFVSGCFIAPFLSTFSVRVLLEEVCYG